LKEGAMAGVSARTEGEKRPQGFTVGIGEPQTSGAVFSRFHSFAQEIMVTIRIRKFY